MRFGLALPQYDYSIAGEDPLRFETLLEYAELAESLGFDSVWLSDHLFLDIGKYGGSPERQGCFEPLTTLAALAQHTQRVRLGTLVLLEALRPASVLAKSLATLDRITGGRLDVGMGAGWYAPEYEAIGMEMPRPGERIDRLREAVTVVTGLLAGEALTFDGVAHRAEGARLLPPPLQQPRPPVFVGGSGPRLLRLAVEHADGWNTCWTWTTADYRAKLDIVEQECERVGRDPATLWRSLGLYSLVGDSAADVRRRYERLQANTPAGVIDNVSLDDWRARRLVGTVQEVREQVEAWESLGVETIILGVGTLPFQVGCRDDVEALADALGLGSRPASST